MNRSCGTSPFSRPSVASATRLASKISCSSVTSATVYSSIVSTSRSPHTRVDGCHTYCLVPKLKEIPDGDWFCVKCVAKKHKAATPKARSPAIEQSLPFEDFCQKRGRKASAIVEDDEDDEPVNVGRPRRTGRALLVDDDSEEDESPKRKKTEKRGRARVSYKEREDDDLDADESDHDYEVLQLTVAIDGLISHCADTGIQ